MSVKNFTLKPLFIVLFLTGLLGVGCSSTIEKLDENTAEGAYKIAEVLIEQERYEEALTYLRRVKNKFPYSKYATEAKLRIGDIHMQREEYIEAESAYKLFKEFHPKHAKIDYVTFQLAMSYYLQLPRAIGRDMQTAEPAIRYFKEVYSTYPQSDYSASAKDHHLNVLKLQARKNLYVADYYFIREMYDSALSRYEDGLKRFPNIGFNARMLFGASVSAFKEKDLGKSKTYYQALIDKFPESKEARQIKDEVGEAI